MRARMRGSMIVGVTLLFGAAACGSGDGGLSSELLASFEGVYQLDAATENPTACDVEGASVLDGIAQKQFVAVAVHVLTISGLQVISCADDAACADTAMKAKAGSGWAASWSW